VRALVQRVSRASVRVDGESVGAIDGGFLVLLGVTHGDDEDVADALARKVVGLRVFEDGAGKMNLDLAAAGGAVLCVSQFTLYGSVRKGRRPSFTEAAEPERAEALYDRFCATVEGEGVRCERGRFGAHMEVESVNDGPVTLLIDSAELERPRRA
jgi:D-tyrosyl-tRNA(Tyr) deacylase